MQWTEIGRIFHRDHSTAIHGVTVVSNQRTFAKSFENKVIEAYESQLLSVN
jgi:chromosomal replication initiation ATPase DnaA